MLKLITAVAAVSVVSLPALAQSAAPAAGIPPSQAVNPAPDAPGTGYLGHGKSAFYNPMERERTIAARLRSAVASGRISPAASRIVERDLSRVVSEDQTQRERHGGGLRDWDRERLNDMMNHIVSSYPTLRS